MDWAKEAYRKAEALEARAAEEKSAGGVALTDPQGEFAEAEAGALVAVTATTEGEGRAAVTFCGAEVAELTVPGTSSVVFAAAERGNVGVAAEDGAKVTRVVLTVAGGNVRALYSPVLLRADGGENGTYALTLSADGATLYSSESGVFAESCRIGEADDADVCADGPAVAFACGGHAYAMFPGSVRGASYLGRGRLVALCRDAAGYLAAAYDGERVTVYELDERLRAMRASSCHGSPTVSALAFVKGKARAMLVVCDGGRNLLRRVLRAGDCGKYTDAEVKCV